MDRVCTVIMTGSNTNIILICYYYGLKQISISLKQTLLSILLFSLLPNPFYTITVSANMMHIPGACTFFNHLCIIVSLYMSL